MQHKIMEKTQVDYISKVFKGLPEEKQDNLLNTAQQLLKIQENDTFPVFVNKQWNERNNDFVIT